MLLTLIAGLTLAATGGDLVCAVTGTEAADLKGAFSDYNGVRYWYCCGGCQAPFEKDPARFVEMRAKGTGTAGVFLFDPVTGSRITPEKAIQDVSEYKGIRFHFASADNKAKFDADPKKYGTLPEKEALYCGPGKEAVPSYAASSGFVDYKGVRYYMCCAGCEKPWAKEPDKHAEASKAYLKKPGIATEKKKSQSVWT